MATRINVSVPVFMAEELEKFTRLCSRDGLSRSERLMSLIRDDNKERGLSRSKDVKITISERTIRELEKFTELCNKDNSGRSGCTVAVTMDNTKKVGASSPQEPEPAHKPTNNDVPRFLL